MNGARAYLSALSVLNEGADFVLTIQEVSEGNLAAAFGFLPVIPAGVFSQEQLNGTGLILVKKKRG